MNNEAERRGAHDRLAALREELSKLIDATHANNVRGRQVKAQMEILENALNRPCLSPV